MAIADSCCYWGRGAACGDTVRLGWSNSGPGASAYPGLLVPSSSSADSGTLFQLHWLLLTLGSHTLCFSTLITWGRPKYQRRLLHFSFAPLALRGSLTGFSIVLPFSIWSMVWGFLFTGPHLRETISFPFRCLFHLLIWLHNVVHETQ